MRTFTKCYPTLRWQIFRHYEPDIYFFVSCVDDEQAKSADLLKDHHTKVYIERIKDPELPEIPTAAGVHAPYANAATHKKLLLQHWNNKRVFQFFYDQMPKDCRTIIRIRPDLWIHRFIKPPDPLLKECYCPWWGKFGGINDRLAVMGNGAAFAYFEMFDQIDELLAAGCPFHPETLVAASLALGDIKVHNTLMASFSTERMDGTRRWPEMIMDDIAELINGKA